MHKTSRHHQLSNLINNREFPSCDVLFMVGTHHLPFTRLLTWAVQYAKEQEHQNILFQFGETPIPEKFHRPNNMLLVKSLTQEEMQQLRPAQIVLPAGPSLMMEWIRRGYRPLLVPRDPELCEHIDEHQQLFAAQMQRLDLIDLVVDYAQLTEYLRGEPKEQSTLAIKQLSSPKESTLRFAQLVKRIVTD